MFCSKELVDIQRSNVIGRQHSINTLLTQYLQDYKLALTFSSAQVLCTGSFTTSVSMVKQII